MYQVRAELEGLAAQLSARWITDQQLVDLRIAHDEFVQAVKELRGDRDSPSGADPKWFEQAAQRWIDMKAKFHKTINDASNNRYLARTILDVTSGYARSVMLSSASGMKASRIRSTVVH